MSFLNCTHVDQRSPVETVHFLLWGSWDWLVRQGSQSCLSSLRRNDVQRRGSTGNFHLPGLHQQDPGGLRTEGGAGVDELCWVAPTLPKEIKQ